MPDRRCKPGRRHKWKPVIQGSLRSGWNRQECLLCGARRTVSPGGVIYDFVPGDNDR